MYRSRDFEENNGRSRQQTEEKLVCMLTSGLFFIDPRMLKKNMASFSVGLRVPSAFLVGVAGDSADILIDVACVDIRSVTACNIIQDWAKALPECFEDTSCCLTTMT
jgi:hypothetical protein